jgi:hypothetical protein
MEKLDPPVKSDLTSASIAPVKSDLTSALLVKSDLTSAGVVPVELNVGGEFFDVSPETLLKIPYFQGYLRTIQSKGPQPRMFIDCSKHAFELLLIYVRGGHVDIPQKYLHDFDYFGITIEQSNDISHLPYELTNKFERRDETLLKGTLGYYGNNRFSCKQQIYCSCGGMYSILFKIYDKDNTDVVSNKITAIEVNGVNLLNSVNAYMMLKIPHKVSEWININTQMTSIGVIILPVSVRANTTINIIFEPHASQSIDYSLAFPHYTHGNTYTFWFEQDECKIKFNSICVLLSENGYLREIFMSRTMVIVDMIRHGLFPRENIFSITVDKIAEIGLSPEDKLAFPRAVLKILHSTL